MNRRSQTDRPHQQWEQHVTNAYWSLSLEGKVLNGRSTDVIEDHLGGHDGMVICAGEC